MIHPNGSYTSRQVAELVFGKKSVEWFYNNHKTLTKDDGFPPPIASTGQPRWSGATLLAWMQRWQETRTTTGGADLSNVLNLRLERMRRDAEARRRA